MSAEKVPAKMFPKNPPFNTATPAPIMIECGSQCFTHMRIVPMYDSVAYVRGVMDDKKVFRPAGPVERTYFSDAPELRELWDNLAWNISSLMAFVEMFCDAEDEDKPISAQVREDLKK